MKYLRFITLIYQIFFVVHYTYAKEVQQPQLVVAIISRIGTPFSNVRAVLQDEMRKAGYVTERISIKKIIEQHTRPTPDKNLTLALHYKSLYLSTKNLIKINNDKEILGKLIVNKILSKKQALKKNNLCFIVDVVKNLDDIKFLRKVYGNNLIVISIHTA